MTYVVPIWKILSSNFSLLTMLQIQRSGTSSLKLDVPLKVEGNSIPSFSRKEYPR